MLESSCIQVINRFPGQWSPAILLDPLGTQYELKGLQSDTEYIINIRLLNEAGVAEQKVTKHTSKSRIGKLFD